MTSITFKISLASAKDNEIRRLRIANPISLQELTQRIVALFNLACNESWKLKWTDEEGDAITISEQYELDDVINSVPENSVVRLTIHPGSAADRRPVAPFNLAEEMVRGFVDMAESLTESISTQRQQAQAQSKKERKAPCQQPSNHCPRKSQGKCHRQQPQPAQTNPTAPPITVSGSCDVTGKPLRLGAGKWYHVPGTTYDICGEEYDKLDSEAQANFVEVTEPESLGDEVFAYARLARGCHRSRVQATETTQPQCPRFTGRCPYRQQPTEPVHCPVRVQNESEGNLHTHLAFCDVTNDRLFPGCGWYHKINENYDLNEAAFQALDDKEKSKFVRVNTGADLGADEARYSVNRFVPRHLRNMFDGLIMEVPTRTSAAPADVEIPVFQPTEERQQPFTDPSVYDERKQQDDEDDEDAAIDRALVDAVLVDELPRMVIVSGPSLAVGTNVDVGTRLMPVWEVMNTSNRSDSIWTDVRVRPRNPNPLRVREEGFEVPMLEAGAAGMVCVEFVVPEECAGQRVEAVFDLYDREGNNFGEPLIVTLDVKCPQREQFNGLLRALAEMGFEDVAANTEALQRANLDLNDAVLGLLQANRN